jgi:hypothetical protein
MVLLAVLVSTIWLFEKIDKLEVIRKRNRLRANVRKIHSVPYSTVDAFHDVRRFSFSLLQ